MPIPPHVEKLHGLPVPDTPMTFNITDTSGSKCGNSARIGISLGGSLGSKEDHAVMKTNTGPEQVPEDRRVVLPDRSLADSLALQCSVEDTPNGPNSIARATGTHTTFRVHPAKKPRLTESNGDAEKHSLTISSLSLPDLPYDILEEILSQTGDPRDLLATARTCKELCRKLTDFSASRMWKKMRKSIHIGLPDPAAYNAEVKDAGSCRKITGVRCFTSSDGLTICEAAYASFVFDGGPCEICGHETESPLRSFALRLRLCNKSDCLQKLRGSESLLGWLTESELQPAKLIVPVLEANSTLCTVNPGLPAEPSNSNRIAIQPRNSTELMPMTLILVIPVVLILCSRLNLSVRAKPPRSRKNDPNFVGAKNASCQSRDAGIAATQNDLWMRLCVDLVKWCQAWEDELCRIRAFNELKEKNFAEDEGWDHATMLNLDIYRNFRSGKLRRRERIADNEFEELRPSIAHELYIVQQRKKEKARKKLEERNMNDLWKLYQKMRSRTQEYPYLPPFHVFLRLPAIGLLRSPDLAKAQYDVKHAIVGGSCVKGMLKQQIEDWVEEGKRDLLMTLGGSPEWNSMVAARRMPHPVLRLDARWKCKVCGGVEPKYEMDGCLDFAGVCCHRCQEEDKKKKRKGVVTRDWNASNFVRDELACAVVKKCLNRLDITEGATVDRMRSIFELYSWRCTTCDPPLFLRAQSIIGHSHRHSVSMEIEIVPQEIVLSMLQRPNPFGLAKWLVTSSSGAKAEASKVNFGCQHCANLKKNIEGAPANWAPSSDSSLPTNDETASVKPDAALEMDLAQDINKGPDFQRKRKGFENKFNFNGLRSHLGSKHKIYEVRDEDFWSYNRVSFPGDRSCMPLRLI